MAIDGLGIMDGDSANDVYNKIMEKYHFGEPIEKIKCDADMLESDFAGSELEHEIFTTAYVPVCNRHFFRFLESDPLLNDRKRISASSAGKEALRSAASNKIIICLLGEESKNARGKPGSTCTAGRSYTHVSFVEFCTIN